MTPDDRAEQSAKARLAANARAFRPDPTLERFASLFETDRAAFNKLPHDIKSQLDVYNDLRGHYRRAVDAGLIPADRGSAA